MIRWCLAVVAGASACASPASQVSPRRSAPVAVTSAPFVATPVEYVAPIEAAVRRRCPVTSAVNVPPAAGAKVKLYEFTAIELDATFGSTPATQPRASFVRDPEVIRTAILRETPMMADCLRVAVGAGVPITGTDRLRDFLDVYVELSVDPFGAVSDVKVEAPPRLAACLTTTLLAVRVPHQAADETHVTVRLDFSRLGGVKPLKVLPARAAIAPVRGHCFIASDPLPVDELTLTSVPIDFGTPPPPRPRRDGPRDCRAPDVDKAQVRAAVNAVLGDLRGCYLAALARQPELHGTVTSAFVVGPLGELTQIAISGVGDDALHTCFSDALASTATRTYPEAPVSVTFPFTLTRSIAEPAPLDRRAERALAHGDRELAAASYAELARTATTAEASCRARAAMVTAYLGTGVPDPRAMPALESLATFVDANAHAELGGCITDLAPTVGRLGRFPVRDDDPDRMKSFRGSGLAEAIEREQLVIKLFPRFERASLPFIADGLAMLLEYDDARDAYLELLSLGNDDPEQVMRAADGYARATRGRDEHLPWDDCTP